MPENARSVNTIYAERPASDELFLPLAGGLFLNDQHCCSIAIVFVILRS